MKRGYSKFDPKNVEFYLKSGTHKSGVKNFNMEKALMAFCGEKSSFNNGLLLALKAGGVPEMIMPNTFLRTIQTVQRELERRGWNENGSND